MGSVTRPADRGERHDASTGGIESYHVRALAAGAWRFPPPLTSVYSRLRGMQSLDRANPASIEGSSRSGEADERLDAGYAGTMAPSRMRTIRRARLAISSS